MKGAAFLSLLATAKAALYDQTVQIEQGKLIGTPALNSSYGSYLDNWEDITVWRGVPFGASTAGNNRFRAPQPPPSWNGTLKATRFGPGCPQSLSIGGSTTSEDCLYANIWSPANATSDKLPVVIWSYGAGGSSEDSTFDGAGLASKGVVFVNYNYRTGPLGWLAISELAGETPTNSTGDYGLLDQIEIVKWVKKNIASFGGDPDAITIVGQSFGSGAVYHTVNSPLAKGLIKGAIAESGIKDPYDPNTWGFGSDYRNMTWALDFSNTFAKSLNATSVADLRALDIDTLMTGTGVSAFIGFDPVLDGCAIPNKYIKSLEDGAPNNVPILVGNNKDEDDVSLSLNITVAEYEADVKSTYGKYASRFLSLWPASNYTQASNAENNIDRTVTRSSTWSWAKRWSKTSNQPVYYYYWTHAPPDQDSGAYHASEIPYALNNLYATTTTNWTETDYQIADKLSSYWANFAKTQNPNKGGSYGNGTLPYWGANVPEKNVTFEVGDAWRDLSVATSEQLELILEWFQYAQPSPY